MYVDDSGMIKKLPVNERACALAARLPAAPAEAPRRRRSVQAPAHACLISAISSLAALHDAT